MESTQSSLTRRRESSRTNKDITEKLTGMVSQTKKSVFIYGLLLLSSVFHGNAQLVGQTQTFSQTEGFKNTQGFTNTQFGSAPFYPNTLPAPAPAPFHPASTGFYSKGYASPLYTNNLFYDYAHPVNAQYWTGHPAVYPSYPPQQYGYQQYGYQQGGYMQNGQSYGYNGYPSWNYPASQYGYWGVHPAYSLQYTHYPNFNANYWTGHPGMYVPAYAHQVPYYGPSPYPYYYPQSYYYGKPRSFLGNFAQSGLAKGLLGALMVGLVAGKIARGK